MSERSRKKLALIALCAALSAFHPSSTRAEDLDLEEGIDAELDSSLGIDGAKPKSAPTSQAATPATPASGDELDLDAPEEKTADAPATPPATGQAADQAKSSAAPEPEIDLGDENPTAPAPQKSSVAKEPAPTAPQQAPQQASPEPQQAASEGANGVFDSADAAKEKRFNGYARAYKPVNEQKWEEIVGERHQENYNVQSGDTLWDISSTFFGDGFYWAKLWSENSSIENPHRIFKGKAIRFLAGTEADAPVVAVADTLPGSKEVQISINTIKEVHNEQPVYREQAEKEISRDELESGNVIELDELVSSPEIPPSTTPHQPAGAIPPSFAEKKKLDDGYNKEGISVSGSALTTALKTPARMLAISFIMDEEPASEGKVEEIELGEHYAALGQSIYVRMGRKAAMGDHFTAVNIKNKVGKGYVVEVGGVIVISGYVDEAKNVYRATVVANANPIERGAALIAEAPPIANFNDGGKISEVDVTVIGGEYDDNRRLIGDGSIIYLSGGKGAGLKKGDILGVQARRDTRREDTRYGSASHAIAKIRVIDVRERVATALITHASDPVSIGDHTGGAVPQPQIDLLQETTDEISNLHFGYGEN